MLAFAALHGADDIGEPERLGALGADVAVVDAVQVQGLDIEGSRPMGIPLRSEEGHVVSSRRGLRACPLAVSLLAPDVTGKWPLGRWHRRGRWGARSQVVDSADDVEAVGSASARRTFPGNSHLTPRERLECFRFFGQAN